MGGDLVASDDGNQVVKTTKVDSGQIVYYYQTFKLIFLVYQLCDTEII